MFLTVHATAGIALGTFTGNPLIAFLLGFFSHFVLDMVPHGDEHIGNILPDKYSHVEKIALWAIADFTVMTVVLLTVLKSTIALSPFVLLAGASGAIVPDFLLGISILKNPTFLKPLTWIHNEIHALLKSPIPFRYGILVQLTFFSGLLYQLIG